MKYRLSWTNHKGEKKTLDLHTRANAVRLLNVLILDNGYHDARLTTVRTREVVIDTNRM